VVTGYVWDVLDTPVGPVSVGCSSSGVARVRFGAPPGMADTAPGTPAGVGAPGRAAGEPGAKAVLRAARAQLAEYLSGQRRVFELPLDWSAISPLQREILATLSGSVGYGQTVAYGDLARRSGALADVEFPARAVGQVMGANPIPVIVPCHRVLASDGLGGYSGGAGLEVKRWLLILEGALPPTLDWEPARPGG
jgi:methylated-DNA-[protein]-cysteine S-methyltransferase